MEKAIHNKGRQMKSDEMSCNEMTEGQDMRVLVHRINGWDGMGTILTPRDKISYREKRYPRSKSDICLIHFSIYRARKEEGK